MSVLLTVMFAGATVTFAEVCAPVGFAISKKGSDVLIRCNDELPVKGKATPAPRMVFTDCNPVVDRKPERITITCGRH